MAEPRVDAHHHVWDLSVRDQPWTADLPRLRRSFDIDELRPQLTRAGFVRTVVVQTVTVPGETPELLRLASVENCLAGVVGWVDLTAADVGDRLAELRAGVGGEYLVGIRHQVQAEPDPGWLARPDVRRGLRAVAAAGLVYDLVVTVDQMPAVCETVAALTEVRFVLDHAGKPAIRDNGLVPWREEMRRLAAHPHVAVKLSGLVTEADWEHWTVAELRPYAEVTLDYFGPQRVMFGSDWPVCLLASSYSDVVATAENLVSTLDDAERAAVFGGTARDWYGLEVS
jgi:L-fuconolactonase